MSNRVIFLIDGFNLYHSVCDAIHDGQPTSGKWLNIWDLCKSFLNVFGKDAVIQDVFYFSAYASHMRDPDAPRRHQVFVKALKSTGVKPILGTFKRKRIKCRGSCKEESWGHEEKETDVNIAVKLIELLYTNACETVVIVSGDTDLASAIKAAKRLFPNKKLGVGFPYKREHAELKQLSDFNFKIQAQHYSRFAFPDPVMLGDGTTIPKPATW